MNGHITLVSGTLGGGKTLYAVERIVYALERGGTVFTNISLNVPAIAAWLAAQGLLFDPSRLTVLTGDIRDFYEVLQRGTPDNLCTVVVDEASMSDAFNSRSWADTSKELLDFNRLVRKLDIFLVYIAQNPEHLDKQIRSMCQMNVSCRNFKYYKLFGVIPFPFPILLRVHLNQTFGGKPAKSHTDIVWAPKWLYGLYDSDALLGSAAEKVGRLSVVASSPLKRIRKVPLPSSGPSLFLDLVALCVPSFVLLFC